MSPKHSNTDVGWIKRKFASIDKQLRELSAAKKLQASTIGKGGLTITDGGSFSAVYPNGVAATRFGPYREPGGEVGYGLFVNDETGAVIFGAIRYPGIPASAVSSAVDTYFTGDTFLSPATGPEGLSVAANGGISINGGVVGVYITHATTGASPNAFLDPSDNRIWRSTSSRRYKQDIEDAEVDPAEVLQLRPRTWRDKGEVTKDPDTERRYAGLIAEEVDELPTLQQFVSRKDGQAEAVDYDRLSSVALLAVVKDLAVRVADLEAAAKS